MKRSLEKNLISMSVAEREEAIGKLINITHEIEKYSYSFFGRVTEKQAGVPT